MKKKLTVVLCLLVVLSSLFCLTACEKDTPAPTENASVKQYVTGRYELDTIEWSNGIVSSGEALLESEVVMGDMYVELYSDRTAQLSLYGQIRDMEFTDDTMSQIGYSLDSYEFSVGNGKVILKRDGDTYIFVKK